MDKATADDIQKLADLRASGAITAEQYDRLVEPVLARARSSQPTPPEQGRPGPGTQGPSTLRIAAAAGGGALAGVLAADLLRSALADPPPEVLEASFVEATTFTEDGYVTEGQFTVENAAGDVVAEGQYVDQGDYVGDAETAEPPGNESLNAGFDDGGTVDFSF